MIKKLLLVVSLAALLCTACTAQQGAPSGKSSEVPPQTSSEQVAEETPPSSGGEEQPAGYDGDGSDLFTAKLLSTGKPVVITNTGDIVAELPVSNNVGGSIGEKLLFIPGKGAVTYQGDLVFGADYEWMGEFSNGLAPFGFQTKEGSRAGYVDANGTVVIEPVFWGATSFSQGYAAVMISETEWGYIDTSGAIVYRGFADAEPFSEGLAVVSPDKEKYGYISLDGEYVIEPIYQTAFSFSEGLAAVAPMTDDFEDRKYGYIDTAGNYVLDPIYGTAGEFWGGIADVTFGDFRDMEYYFIFPSGEVALEGAFDGGIPVREAGDGVWSVRRMGEREGYFMSATGEKILPDYSPDLFFPDGF